MVGIHKISVVDVNTGNQVDFLAEGDPNVATLGKTNFAPLCNGGFAKFQDKDVMVVSEDSYVDAIIEAVKAHYDVDLVKGVDIGCRGASWATPEERALAKVYVDDEEFTPAITKGGLKKAELVEQRAMAKLLEKEIEVATADTSGIEGKEVYLAQIKDAVANNYTKKDIVGALVNTKKMTIPQAHALYKEVITKPTTPLVL
jgi:hypothetical protein